MPRPWRRRFCQKIYQNSGEKNPISGKSATCHLIKIQDLWGHGAESKALLEAEAAQKTGGVGRSTEKNQTYEVFTARPSQQCISPGFFWFSKLGKALQEGHSILSRAVLPCPPPAWHGGTEPQLGFLQKMGRFKVETTSRKK